MTGVRVSDIVATLAEHYPAGWAEDWDRVGLLAGDPGREVTGVICALDPTRAAIAKAEALGANVLVTHHPAYLKAPEPIVPGTGPAGVVYAALRADVALVNAHTNLDRAPAAGRLLGDLLGLDPLQPIESAPMPITLITTFVPPSHADAVIDAMASAGAGRIGEYERCAFRSEIGSGTFVPRAGTSPFAGTVGERAAEPEVEVQMVAPRHARAAVLAAARTSHPYEEPVIVTTEAEMARSSARMGMLCRVPSPLTLGELASAAARAFGSTPRVWGAAERTIESAVTATGSAGSLIRDTRAAGADLLIAGEVRYHDAMDALDANLCVLELGHDVSEWPLVGLLRDSVMSVPGIDRGSVHVLDPIPRWWTPKETG